MGLDYRQLAIVGIALDLNKLKVVTSPAVYHEQPRYDTNTGKQTHTEQVLAKREEYVYRFDNADFDDAWDLARHCEELICVDGKNTISHHCGDTNTVYVGFEIGRDDNYGRVDLLDGTYNAYELFEMFNTATLLLPGHVIALRLIADVG